MNTMPLWERPDFIPWRVGDVLTAEQVAAVLPGIDGLLRVVAVTFVEEVETGGEQLQTV